LQLISRQGVAAFIHGFSEFNFRFSKLAFVRPMQEAEREVLRSSCESRPLGLILFFQSNNIFHQMYHAAPAWEALREYASTSASQQPPTLIPLAGYLAGPWVHPPTWRSHAWEFTVRALTNLGADAIAEDLRRLLTAPCTCFQRVHGSTGAFTPFIEHKAMVTLAREWSRASVRNAAFAAAQLRLSLHRKALAGTIRADQDILYVMRGAHGESRVVTNEAQLLRAFGVVPRVRAVAMGQLPLVEQMLLASASSVLVGVHGQALSHMAFLPSDRPTALVELLPQPNRQYNEFKNIFRDWCRAQGVRHWSMGAALDRSGGLCQPEGRRQRGGGPLRCNVTVEVPLVLELVQEAAEFTAVGSPASRCEGAACATLAGTLCPAGMQRCAPPNATGARLGRPSPRAGEAFSKPFV
jgi:hypothetical protein